MNRVLSYDEGSIIAKNEYTKKWLLLNRRVKAIVWNENMGKINKVYVREYDNRRHHLYDYSEVIYNTSVIWLGE